jgi:hypothetical protein
MHFLLEDIQGLTHDSDHCKELYEAGIGKLEDLAKIDPVTGQEIPITIKGIKAVYFTTKNLTDPILSRIDNTINFDWGKQSPDPAVPTDNFSVEWKGFFLASVSGDYTFYTESDDGVRLLIDEKVLVENWTNHGITTDSGTISLEAGKYYPLRLQYYEKGGKAIIRLSYETSGIAKTIIPADQLWQHKPFTPLTIPFTSLLRYVSAAQNIILLSSNVRVLLTMEPCSVCGGDSWVTNVTREECKYCNGTGQRSLPDTDTCHICKGEGKIVSKTYIEACSDCNGTGRTSGGVICSSCVGEGCQKIEEKITCWKCNGTGTVSDDHIVKCAPCSGQGIILRRGVLSECEACNGTGAVERINPFYELTALEVFTNTQDYLIEKTGANLLHIDSLKESIGYLAAFLDDNALSNFKMEDK